jgi:hypothetical protein
VKARFQTNLAFKFPSLYRYAPVPEEPGTQLAFPKFGEPALLANKLANWTFEKVTNSPDFDEKYSYRGKLGPQRDSDGDTLRRGCAR